MDYYSIPLEETLVEYLPDLNPNSDGTDHFIVITGRNYDAQKRQFYYTFMDCATTSVENGCSNSNRLYYWEGHDITGITFISAETKHMPISADFLLQDKLCINYVIFSYNNLQFIDIIANLTTL